MNGIAKVIDELGLIIKNKDIEISTYQEEISKLKRKISIIEQCLDIYEACYKNNYNASNSKSIEE